MLVCFYSFPSSTVYRDWAMLTCRAISEKSQDWPYTLTMTEPEAVQPSDNAHENYENGKRKHKHKKKDKKNTK